MGTDGPRAQIAHSGTAFVRQVACTNAASAVASHNAATIEEIATALAALTGEPHSLAA
ncbi:hypothetical protein [Amycolatopsis echigonensis]|uniref:Uncharacterized protein n=1 Tax=Amycolatopsis echigonensis TaxID=2576905 RepID=A0A8E1W7X0_9PSEU|nr:hypothetical protein [Amycolatopsis echigonensis]MBB2505228.1 hypothetical protein [Amycolatopsis echigonensis]